MFLNNWNRNKNSQWAIAQTTLPTNTPPKTHTHTHTPNTHTHTHKTRIWGGTWGIFKTHQVCNLVGRKEQGHKVDLKQGRVLFNMSNLTSNKYVFSKLVASSSTSLESSPNC